MTVEHQTRVTTAKGAELVAALCVSMDRKFLRIEYNIVLSECAILETRFKKPAFRDNQAGDEALLRVTTSAARSSQLTPMLESQEREEAAEQEQDEQQASADKTRRNPSADSILEVRSYLEEPLLQRSADPDALHR